jgi:dihydrodiol dehydrogenase / D-xylose 1-dehydrogenase (NADP)
MNRPPVRWGIIGAGIIAHALADAVARDPDSVLIAVASRSPGKAADFAARYAIDACSYEVLVAREDIDVVYVATTHNAHFDNAMLALAHGKHVLVEKPFMVNAKQARTVVQCARERGRFVMEAMWTRFLPGTRRLQEVLASGRLGEIKHLELRFGVFISERFETRVSTLELAGGVTLDIGVYPISLACHVLGELPNEVKALARFSDTGVDERIACALAFPGGATAVISASYRLAMTPQMTIYGTRGIVDYPHVQNCPAFRLLIHEGTNEIKTVENVSTEHADNGFVYQVAEVVRCLRGGYGESPIMPLDESIGIMAVMDQMRRQWNFSYPFEPVDADV